MEVIQCINGILDVSTERVNISGKKKSNIGEKRRNQ